MAEVTPKTEPVIWLIRINVINAAKAPPALSFAQEPPIAIANRICRLLMIAHPMFSIVLPTVRIREISAPAICTSLPTLIINPAAGITAITVIRTLPSFCRKSKLKLNFFFSFFCGSEVVDTALLSVNFCVSDIAALFSDTAAFFPEVCASALSELFADASAFPAASFAMSISTAVFPASTPPSAHFSSWSSMSEQIRTGVIGLIFFSARYLRSTSATRSPFFTWSPSFTWTLKHSPFKDTVSRPTCTSSSSPSSVEKPYACPVSATDSI